nr:MAG TPA: hypothetical protein [Caudoviricetes sp.]
MTNKKSRVVTFQNQASTRTTAGVYRSHFAEVMRDLH